MNPQFDSTPGLNLPEPSLTPEPVSPMVSPQIAQPYAQPQQPPLPAQQMTPQPQMQPVQPMAPQPVLAQPAPQQVQPQAATPQQATPPSEDDIDQEWINKAKSAVAQFQMDPYSQSNAISRIKAEYLQTRHNITTKLGGDS